LNFFIISFLLTSILFIIGGDSTATYQNVKTRMTMYSYADTIEAGGSLSAYAGMDVEVDMDSCVGGGFGVIAIVCGSVADAKANVGLNMKFGMNTLIGDNGDTKSNQFEITWSYTTSDNPAT